MLENKPEHKNKQFPNSSPVETPLRKNDSSKREEEEEEKKYYITYLYNILLLSPHSWFLAPVETEVFLFG